MVTVAHVDPDILVHGSTNREAVESRWVHPDYGNRTRLRHGLDGPLQCLGRFIAWLPLRLLVGLTMMRMIGINTDCINHSINTDIGGQSSDGFYRVFVFEVDALGT
ncbi:hypothetical protein D3C76_1562140 [compost metagenome]